MSCSMHVVKKKVIQSLLRTPEQEDLFGDSGVYCESQFLKEIGWEDWIVFVRFMVRVIGGFFCTS